MSKDLHRLSLGDDLGEQNRLTFDQKKKLSKISGGLVGLLFGHEWILVALPVLRRFVASNVTIKRNAQGVNQRGALPSGPPIDFKVPVTPSSQSIGPQVKRPEVNKIRKSSGKGALVVIAGVAAFAGLFVVLNQSDESSITSAPVTTGESWESISRSIIYIEVENESELWSGSGSLIIDGSYVLTNFHVAPGSDYSYEVFLTETYKDSPKEGYAARFVVGDEYNDLAIIQIVNDNGDPVIIRGRTIIKPAEIDVNLGEEFTNIGYPGLGCSDAGCTMTITRGSYSGNLQLEEEFLRGEYLKTDGMLSFGVSGGATFNSRFEFVGVPSGGTTDNESGAALGYIKPARYAVDLIAKVQK